MSLMAAVRNGSLTKTCFPVKRLLYHSAANTQRAVFWPRLPALQAAPCTTIQAVGQRRTFSFMPSLRITRLQQDAEASPTNAKKQHEFYRELLKIEPEEVVRRFESGQFASNEQCISDYLKALVSTNRLDKTDLTKVLGQLQTASVGSPVAAGLGSAGNEAHPIYVALREPGIRVQVWRTLRLLLLSLLLFSGISAVMEDRGLGKGMSIHSEVEPQAQTRTYTFDDVQGVDEAKDELEEIVKFLQSPSKFTRLGGKLPKGVLLMGPPGTGKTLLARAVAGEASVPFFYCSGSEFDEMFVGVGARRVRELFAAAKRRQPCIVFIDEIDAIGGTRNPKDQNYVKMTLNQLLVEMDGFQQNDGVIVIAATNFPELLDKALIRPGRFDKHVVVPLPDVKGRQEILELHMKDVPKASTVNLRVIARGTPGLSGAELANIVNQAALKASVDGEQYVTMSNLEYAKDKILMGAERKSAVIDEKNRRLVAYHEGGHALVAINSDGAMPVHKATIMPRGHSLGMVSQLPENDDLSWTRKQLLARLQVCMGGRAAEEIIFGLDEVTSGASNDFEQATNLARLMVTKYGMSDKVGLLQYDSDDLDSAGPETRSTIDQEVRRLCQDAYDKAKQIINKHRKQLESLASALLEHETLTADEIKTVLSGQRLASPTKPSPSPSPAPGSKDSSDLAGHTPGLMPMPNGVPP